jgi:hypothetical protein
MQSYFLDVRIQFLSPPLVQDTTAHVPCGCHGHHIFEKLFAQSIRSESLVKYLRRVPSSTNKEFRENSSSVELSQITVPVARCLEDL